MSLPRYPKYKPSGADWLNDVPEHWDVKRIGYYFTERREKVSDVDFPALSVTKNGILPQLETAAKTDDGDNRKKVCKGDFVINSRSDRKGASGISALDGSISLINTVITPRNSVSGSFVHHLFRSYNFQEEYYRYGKGIVADLWSTNYSEMRNILLALPPLPEQTAIATFLDRETAKIDTLIAEQEKLIALLKEKRQAVISHAVTKGLDPKVKMKDSGVEWLGEVPEHWSVGKCGFHLKILSGFAFPSSGFSVNEGGVKLLRGVNVGVGSLRWDETVFWERKEADNLDDYVVKNGDIVIGMDRPIISDGIRVAKVTISDLPCLLLQRVASLKTGPRLSPDFLLELLNSKMFAAHILPETTGVSVPHISPEQIGKFPVAIPTLNEQYEITKSIFDYKTKSDNLVTEAEKGISLLKERRSALISAAVTGQVDVRGLL